MPITVEISSLTTRAEYSVVISSKNRYQSVVILKTDPKEVVANKLRTLAWNILEDDLFLT